MSDNKNKIFDDYDLVNYLGILKPKNNVIDESTISNGMHFSEFIEIDDNKNDLFGKSLMFTMEIDSNGERVLNINLSKNKKKNSQANISNEIPLRNTIEKNSPPNIDNNNKIIQGNFFSFANTNIDEIYIPGYLSDFTKEQPFKTLIDSDPISPLKEISLNKENQTKIKNSDKKQNKEIKTSNNKENKNQSTNSNHKKKEFKRVLNNFYTKKNNSQKCYSEISKENNPKIVKQENKPKPKPNYFESARLINNGLLSEEKSRISTINSLKTSDNLFTSQSQEIFNEDFWRLSFL